MLPFITVVVLPTFVNSFPFMLIGVTVTFFISTGLPRPVIPAATIPYPWLVTFEMSDSLS